MGSFIELLSQDGQKISIKATSIDFIAEEFTYGDSVTACVLVNGFKCYVKDDYEHIKIKLEEIGYRQEVLCQTRT